MNIRDRIIAKIKAELESANARLESWREHYDWCYANDPHGVDNAAALIVDTMRQIKKLEDELAQWEGNK